MSVEVEAFITKYLCQNRGYLDYKHLYPVVRQRYNVTDEDLLGILSDSSKFVLTKDNVGNISDSHLTPDTRITAKTKVRVCQRRENNCDSCNSLHLCRYFVCGDCRYRANCRYCHDLESYHNTAILVEEQLISLSQQELFQLLLQNDPYLLPNICYHYNMGNGEHAYCKFEERCTSLHVCKYFLQKECRFGKTCRRAHAFNQTAKNILKRWGLGLHHDRLLQTIYRNKFVIAESTKTASVTHLPPLTEPENKEICLFSFHSQCLFKDKCHKAHYPLPYWWQVLDSDDDEMWKDLPNMEHVEMDYCKPENDFSEGDLPVNFLTMTCGSTKVRRLSTASSVTKVPRHRSFTTEWLWYWKDSQGQWNLFEFEDDYQSQNLEKKYLDDISSEIDYSIDSQRYVLSFKDMYLQKRGQEARMEVRRRPRFVSAEEMQEKMNRRSCVKSSEHMHKA